MSVFTYLVGKRNWSRVSASWNHICWKCLGCLRARGRPVRSTVNRLVTANFQVPGDWQPYLIDSGTCSACKSQLQFLQLHIFSSNNQDSPLKWTWTCNNFPACIHAFSMAVSYSRLCNIKWLYDSAFVKMSKQMLMTQ